MRTARPGGGRRHKANTSRNGIGGKPQGSGVPQKPNAHCRVWVGSSASMVAETPV
jgi:hypothetical protein